MSAASIAIDLGAESGRVIVGTLADGRIQLEEVHRFAHEPISLPTGLHWNITGMWREVVAGLRLAAQWAEANRVRLTSVGVDTWGVDWALLDASGELVGLPHAYRDPRNQPACDQAVAQLGAERIYEATGIQFMALNTLYSLYAHRLADSGALEAADRLLFLPDLFHHWLSGTAATEATIASTSQMVDCHTGDWARPLLDELGIPTHILGPITPPGRVLGTLRSALASETGLPADLPVVAPGSHDTASAVAAVPGGAASAAGKSDWCFLSSGTWSILGAELPAPLVNEAARREMFTNELGVCGKTRFLKNIPGLWLVQECRRDYERQGRRFTYAELADLAAAAPPFRTLLNPEHAEFQAPGNMSAKVAGFARSTGQPEPSDAGSLVRCCLESLALSYRDKLLALESILGRSFAVLHIVGGGGKNALLCQMTADATGRRVVVGPYEATATGNALVQMMAIGAVADLAELRRIVAQSFDLTTYEPSETSGWTSAYNQFKTIL